MDLLFAFDGTNNDWKSDTNIRKIVELYDGDYKYYKGIGTGKGEGNIQNAGLGKGAQKRIDEALKYFEDYLSENPDEHTIDVIGFSRGAATARSFVRQIQPLLEKHEVEIRFIGLFDTVPAMLGENDTGGRFFAEKVEHNLRLPEKYKDKDIAFHAMSIHENRSKFRLFRYDGADEKWFAGAHSDIGGWLS